MCPRTPYGDGLKLLFCFLCLVLLQFSLLHSSDAEDWKSMAIEYREISIELAAELKVYQTEFPRLLEITSNWPEKLTQLQQISREILTRQEESLRSSLELTNELQQPLNDLKLQIGGLQSSLAREIRKTERLSYIVIALTGIITLDTVIRILLR